MEGTTEQSFKERLDGYYDWPCAYLFKFIAPREKLDEVKGLFEELSPASGEAEVPLRTRDSAQGNYVSVTAEPVMSDSDAVIAVYRKAAEIDGVVPL